MWQVAGGKRGLGDVRQVGRAMPGPSFCEPLAMSNIPLVIPKREPSLPT